MPIAPLAGQLAGKLTEAAKAADAVHAANLEAARRQTPAPPAEPEPAPAPRRKVKA